MLEVSTLNQMLLLGVLWHTWRENAVKTSTPQAANEQKREKKRKGQKSHDPLQRHSQWSPIGPIS